VGEAEAFPFARAGVSEKEARAIWTTAFQALLDFAALEDELYERHIAVKQGIPVVNPEAFVARGHWLRQQELALGKQISDGSVWGLSNEA